MPRADVIELKPRHAFHVFLIKDFDLFFYYTTTAAATHAEKLILGDSWVCHHLKLKLVSKNTFSKAKGGSL